MESFQLTGTSLQDIIQQAPIAIGFFEGRDMVIRVGNPTIFELWGKDNSITGMPIKVALPELEGQPFVKILEDVFDNGIPFYGKGYLAKLLRNQILEDIYFDFTYSPIRNEKGIVTGVMVTASDVTERELAKNAIEESENKLNIIIKNAPLAIGLYVGKDMVIENPNQIFIDILGKGPGIKGKPLREALPELISEGQPFLKILDDVYTKGILFNTEGTLIKILREGVMTNNFYDFSYTPVFDGNGETFAIVVIAKDVTDQMLSKQRLIESEERLESIMTLTTSYTLLLMI